MIDAEQIARRIVQTAMQEATAAHWLRRAQQFENARPRPDDYRGRATTCDLREADARMIADACRHRATLCESYDFVDLYEAVLAEAA